MQGAYYTVCNDMGRSGNELPQKTYEGAGNHPKRGGLHPGKSAEDDAEAISFEYRRDAPVECGFEQAVPGSAYPETGLTGGKIPSAIV